MERRYAAMMKLVSFIVGPPLRRRAAQTIPTVSIGDRARGSGGGLQACRLGNSPRGVATESFEGGQTPVSGFGRRCIHSNYSSVLATHSGRVRAAAATNLLWSDANAYA